MLEGTVYSRTVNNGSLYISGGTTTSNGGVIEFYGKDHTLYPGFVSLKAQDSNNYSQMVIQPNGSFRFYINGVGKNLAMEDDTIPLTGTSALAGSIVPSTDDAYQLGSNTKNLNAVFTGRIVGNGDNLNIYSVGYGQGALIALDKNDTSYNGSFRIYTGTPAYVLQGSSTGILTWSGSYFQTANLELQNTYPKINFKTGSSSDVTSYIIDSGSSTYSSIAIRPTTPSYNSYNFTSIGFFEERSATLGLAEYRWGQIYSTNSAISTSDERQKDNIKQIDDKLLQAWGNVNLVQFNFKDALEKKGANARLHTGYIAQNIQQACEENGVNPSDYGLFCFDSWEEQEEKKDKNGRVIKPYRPKGDLYSLRYEEALVVECAFLRREVKRLSERLEKLEK